MKKYKVVIVGSGFSGAIVARGLRDLDRVDLHYFEKSQETEAQDTSTGLNLNPNGLAALELLDPELVTALRSFGLPRNRIRASSFTGELLFDECIFKPDYCDSLASCSGLRVRWRDACNVLRTCAPPQYGCMLTNFACNQGSLDIEYFDTTIQAHRKLHEVDLLIAGDGRYSVVRERLSHPRTQYSGVSNFRALMPDTSSGLFDDMELYYNVEANRSYPKSWGAEFAHCLAGLSRIGIMKMPYSDKGNPELYLYGNFPIPDQVPVAAKSAAGLRALFTPKSGKLSAQGAFLLGALQDHATRFHWVRMQHINPAFTDPSGRILLLGDSAHATVPTLGQGATSAIEDAVEATSLLRAFFLNLSRQSLSQTVHAIAKARAPRAAFVSAISLDATEHLIAGNRTAKLEQEVTAWTNHESQFRIDYRQLMRGFPVPFTQSQGPYATELSQ